MKELFEAMIDLHAITMLRQSAVITALENKRLITRAEVDSIQKQISDVDADIARDKVRSLFAACFKDHLEK